MCAYLWVYFLWSRSEELLRRSYHPAWFFRSGPLPCTEGVVEWVFSWCLWGGLEGTMGTSSTYWVGRYTRRACPMFWYLRLYVRWLPLVEDISPPCRTGHRTTYKIQSCIHQNRRQRTTPCHSQNSKIGPIQIYLEQPGNPNTTIGRKKSKPCSPSSAPAACSKFFFFSFWAIRT